MGPRGDDDSQLLSQRGLIAGIRKAVCGETYWLGPATPLIGISTSRLFLYKATGHCFHPIAGDWKDPKMALETIDMTRAREGLRSAVEQERAMLADLRGRVREFEIHELGYRRCYAISPVATDGGENRLTFEPFNLEILRVVDSDGRERFQKILPLSGGPGIFRAAFDQTFPDHVPLLAQFLERLDVGYDELSYLLNPDRTAGDLRSAVQPFRDIVEWAVLLDIAWNPGQTKALVIRDGLLRSLALRKEILPKLGRSFEEAYREKGSLLVGVAKRSKVLNYLSLALASKGPFANPILVSVTCPRRLSARLIGSGEVGSRNTPSVDCTSRNLWRSRMGSFSPSIFPSGSCRVGRRSSSISPKPRSPLSPRPAIRNLSSALMRARCSTGWRWRSWKTCSSRSYCEISPGTTPIKPSSMWRSAAVF